MRASNPPAADARGKYLFGRFAVVHSPFHDLGQAVFRGESELTVFGRAISKELRDQAFAIFTIGTIWVVSTGIILSVIDGEVHDLEEVIFETVSAFGTVGMGIGITLSWNDWGKALLTLTMLLGRVGIMTFMLSFIQQKQSIIKHPEENVMIG